MLNEVSAETCSSSEFVCSGFDSEGKMKKKWLSSRVLLVTIILMAGLVFLGQNMGIASAPTPSETSGTDSTVATSPPPAVGLGVGGAAGRGSPNHTAPPEAKKDRTCHHQIALYSIVASIAGIACPIRCPLQTATIPPYSAQDRNRCLNSHTVIFSCLVLHCLGEVPIVS